MNDSFLIHEEDMLKDEHLPVVVFYGVISDKNEFLRVIEVLSNGVGFGVDLADCSFPSDVEVESDMFEDGVEFSLDNGEAVIISYEEFYYYLKKACLNYLSKYSTEKDTIERILEKVRKRYNISE